MKFTRAVMAAKMSADHTLYHLSPKGFWKKFREPALLLARKPPSKCTNADSWLYITAM
jgi:hypothetical protein